MFTLKKKFKSFEGLTISWFGDMNNVLFSYFEFIKLFPSINLNLLPIKGFIKIKLKFSRIDNLNFYDEIKNLQLKFLIA